MAEALVDVVARAICKARGVDPDAALSINDAYDDGRPEADNAIPAWKNHRTSARAALAAIDAAGYAVAPKEPTLDMQWAGCAPMRDENGTTAGVWRAMLAAAPKVDMLTP